MPKDFESPISTKVREQIREIEKKIAEYPAPVPEEKRKELESDLKRLKKLLETTDSIYEI